MNHSTYRTVLQLLPMLLLSVFVAGTANAAGISISGSYEIVDKTDLGSQVKVVVRLHLTNRDQTAVSCRGVLLSDFAYRHTGNSHTSPVTVRPGASQEILQEFVIPRSEYDQWQKGLRPRVILDLQTATGTNLTQAVRLERVPGGKGK